MDELRQKNRSLRHQLNLANQEREKQSIDREKALNKLEKSQRDQKRLVTEMDLMMKENNMLQKKLDQNDHQVVRPSIAIYMPHWSRKSLKSGGSQRLNCIVPMERWEAMALSVPMICSFTNIVQKVKRVLFTHPTMYIQCIIISLVN